MKSQKPPICEDYIKRKCNKRSKCSLDHPDLCPLFIRDGHRERGCDKRPEDCPRGHHPHMCNNSFNKRECYTKDCKYRHHPGTRTLNSVKGPKRVFESQNRDEHPPYNSRLPPYVTGGEAQMGTRYGNANTYAGRVRTKTGNYPHSRPWNNRPFPHDAPPARQTREYFKGRPPFQFRNQAHSAEMYSQQDVDLNGPVNQNHFLGQALEYQQFQKKTEADIGSIKEMLAQLLSLNKLPQQSVAQNFRALHQI